MLEEAGFVNPYESFTQDFSSLKRTELAIEKNSEGKSSLNTYNQSEIQEEFKNSTQESIPRALNSVEQGTNTSFKSRQDEGALLMF